jgi:uncharacterized protein (DUF1778 family)
VNEREGFDDRRGRATASPWVRMRRSLPLRMPNCASGHQHGTPAKTCSARIVDRNQLVTCCRTGALTLITRSDRRSPCPEFQLLNYRETEAAHRSLSDFVLESALTRAEETLADQKHFGLDADQWEKFMQALDAPVRSHPRMEKLLYEPSLFDPK